MEQKTKDALVNEALGFTGTVPDYFNEEYCHSSSLIDAAQIDKLNIAERVLWYLGQERLVSGKEEEGLFFFNEAYTSFIRRHNQIPKYRTLAIDILGMVYHGKSFPVYINIDGPIGDEC